MVSFYGISHQFRRKAGQSKGLNKMVKPDEEKVKTYFFPEDYHNISLLADIPE